MNDQGIVKAFDSDGDPCFEGWGFTFGMDGVARVRESRAESLYETREAAVAALAGRFQDEIDSLTAHAKHLRKAIRALRIGHAAILRGERASSSLLLAGYLAKQTAEAEIELRREKRRLRAQLKALK